MPFGYIRSSWALAAVIASSELLIGSRGALAQESSVSGVVETRNEIPLAVKVSLYSPDRLLEVTSGNTRPSKGKRRFTKPWVEPTAARLKRAPQKPNGLQRLLYLPILSGPRDRRE